jgi:hypothetical protein
MRVHLAPTESPDGHINIAHACCSGILMLLVVAVVTLVVVVVWFVRLFRYDGSKMHTISNKSLAYDGGLNSLSAEVTVVATVYVRGSGTREHKGCLPSFH